MKFLNLDDIVPVKRTIGLKGKEYEVAERSIGQMASAIRLSEAYEASTEENGGDPQLLINSMLEAAKQILPDCPEKILQTISIEQLNALIEFANANDQEVVGASESENEKEEAEPEKK